MLYAALQRQPNFELIFNLSAGVFSMLHFNACSGLVFNFNAGVCSTLLVYALHSSLMLELSSQSTMFFFNQKFTFTNFFK